MLGFMLATTMWLLLLLLLLLWFWFAVLRLLLLWWAVCGDAGVPGLLISLPEMVGLGSAEPTPLSLGGWWLLPL